MRPDREPDFIYNIEDRIVYSFYIEEKLQYNNEAGRCFEIKEENSKLSWRWGEHVPWNAYGPDVNAIYVNYIVDNIILA